LDQYFPVLKWIAYLFELLGRRTLSWLPWVSWVVIRLD
jgi:hypothetical protein